MIQHEPRVGLEMLIDNLQECEVPISIAELEMLRAFATRVHVESTFTALMDLLVVRPE